MSQYSLLQTFPSSTWYLKKHQLAFEFANLFNYLEHNHNVVNKCHTLTTRTTVAATLLFFSYWPASDLRARVLPTHLYTPRNVWHWLGLAHSRLSQETGRGRSPFTRVSVLGTAVLLGAISCFLMDITNLVIIPKRWFRGWLWTDMCFVWSTWYCLNSLVSSF